MRARRSTRILVLPFALVLGAASAHAQPPGTLQPVPTEVLILSPDPGERVAGDAVLVAAAFLGAREWLETSGVVMRIGGRDVTAEAEVRGDVITWRPGVPLQPGPYRVVIEARDPSGTHIAPVSWTFTVPGTGEAAGAQTGFDTPPGHALPAARFRGSMVIEAAGQSASGEGEPFRRDEEFNPRVWLTAGGELAEGWRYSARVHRSGYESSVRQPVDRYSFDVRGPFLYAAVGDVHPVMQDLILAGRRVRGVQGDVRAGPARVSVVTGQSRRAVPGLLDPDDPSAVLRSGTFGQDLLAVRPSIGRGDRFQLGLTMLRVRDDTTSIPMLRTTPGAIDAPSFRASPAPQDNVAAGLDLTLRFAGGRVLMQYENGVSLLANDVSGGPLTQAGLDSLLVQSGNEPWGVDPSRYQRFITLNESLVPLDPRELSNVAHQVRTTVRAGTHQLSFEWRSIGGAYHTLGYPALQRDRRGFRVRDAFTLLNDALVVSAGFEQDRDNLDEVKHATTTSNGGFGTVSWQPGMNSVALIGSFRIGARGNDLGAAEPGAVDETSRIVSAGASIPVPLLAWARTRLSLNGSFTDREDKANTFAGSRDVYLLGGVQGETLTRGTELALMLGMNRTELTGFDGASTDFQRVIATGRHRVLPQLAVLFDAGYTAVRSPDETSDFALAYDRLDVLGGAEFDWATAGLVTVTGGVASYSDRINAGLDTRELIVRVRLSRAF
jgi:hypothetical protein